MNEIGASHQGGPALEKQAQTTKGAQPQTEATVPDKPIAEARTEVVVKAVSEREDIAEVVAEMNEYIQKEQRDLHFSVDEGTGHTVVKVLDRVSGDLIRQMPEEVFLDLARSVKDDQPIQLISALG